jgi:hypothetical protein
MWGPEILVGFQLNLTFLEIFSNNTQVHNVMNIRPVGAELFHAVGRTDGETDRCEEGNGRISQYCERA